MIYIYICIYLGPFRDPTEARTPRSELPAKNLMMSFAGGSFLGGKLCGKRMQEGEATRKPCFSKHFCQRFMTH